MPTKAHSAAPTRAALYLRQSVADGVGIASQRQATTALAAAKGWEVVAEFVDDGVSGTKSRGPLTRWNDMLNRASAGEFDAIVVRDIDRLTRSINDLQALLEVNVPIASAVGELDLSTPSGRTMARVLVSIAMGEVETKAKRQRDRNKDRRSTGTPTSGRTPYGYRWITSADRLKRGDPAAYELDGERAADVRGIFDSFLAGVALGSIARELNEQGKHTVPSKSHPEGAPFRPTTLRRILLSPYYAALLPLPIADGAAYDQAAITRADCVDGTWPAIVTPEEWETVKARLEHPERKTSPGPSRKWLLSGVASCGVCGEPIRAGGGEAGIHSYRCRSMAHFMRRGVPLDSFVERLIITRLSQPDAIDLLAEHDRGDVDALRAERARLEVSIRQAGDDEQDGLITRAERVRLTKRANARVGKIDDDLRRGVDVNALNGLVGQSDVAAAWGQLSLGHKRAVLEALMTVVVHSVGQGNRRNMSDETMAKTVTVEWHR
jgi:site-specific DNA recombinase